MQLLIDFGNTRIKWALQHQGEFTYGGEAVYNQDSLESLLAQWWGELPAPAGILCASVTAQGYNETLEQWCQKQWRRPVTWLQSTARQQGVSNAYQQPQTLGSDRWAALIAGHRMTSHHAGIIDCGSAITVDLLRADGRHQGGYILPGLRLMQQCLLSQTSQVEANPELTEQSGPGDSTQACVSQATTRAIIAFLDDVMHKTPPQYDNRLEWLLTGGDSAWLQPRLAGPCRLVPDLVLRGLAYLVEGNE